MRRVAALVLAAVAVASACSSSGEGGSSRVPEPPPEVPTVRVGVGSRSLLPTVDGARGYLDQPRPAPTDAVSPGVFVADWDQGRVAVGNGASEAHWVHDDLRVKAVSFQAPGSDRITVLVAANLYMLFQPDADALRRRAEALLPAEVADRVDIAVAVDHVHHGPDTAFDVNHEWFELFLDEAAAAVRDAVTSTVPARLRVGEGEHLFGLADSRDPQVMDPTLGVVQAVGDDGKAVATIVVWGNHPEVTLGWDPPADVTLACQTLGIEPDAADCTAKDRVFTADFPGAMASTIEARVGGTAMFFNGAVGSLVTPLGAAVWEVTDDHPVGDGLTPPEGAEAPGGGTDVEAPNFRRALVIGKQLGIAALGALDDGEWIADPAIAYESVPFYSRLTNFGFRVLGVAQSGSGRPALGHEARELYTCAAGQPKTDATCRPDGGAVADDPLLALLGRDAQHRVGDHLRSEVALVRIGPVGVLFAPGELAPELAVGLPAGYGANPDRWHADDLALHASGSSYTTPGFVKDRMDDRYRWVVGLGNDELGYVLPISDFRVRCIADELAPGRCAALHDAGEIEFPDAIAGSTCKDVTDDPARLERYAPQTRQAVEISCRYGQAFGEAEGHYEETNAAGWDLAEDLLAAVAELTGIESAAMESSTFEGAWREAPTG